MAGCIDRLTPDGIKFYKGLEDLKNTEVCVGFQASVETPLDPNTKQEVDIVQIATWNELGTRTSPPRPFLRDAVDDNKERIASMTATLLNQFINGESAESVLKKLGVFGVKLVDEKILKGPWVPNAPSTIRKKKSDKPLIDTGQMRQSVHYITRKKGS